MSWAIDWALDVNVILIIIMERVKKVRKTSHMHGIAMHCRLVWGEAVPWNCTICTKDIHGWHCDAFYNIPLQVGVGGGSSMDAAKLAAFMCGDTEQVKN